MNLATTPDSRFKFQLSHLYPHADKGSSFVVLTQERLDEMVQAFYHQGFGASLAQSAFGHLSGDEVSDGQPRPGN